MLEELMRECRNWFKVPDGAYSGTFTIKDGSIALPFLAVGQYFRIIGSVFNDGVYQYGADSLTDETFNGVVWALSVPAAFVSLADGATSMRTLQTARFKAKVLQGIVTPNRAQAAILAAL